MNGLYIFCTFFYIVDSISLIDKLVIFQFVVIAYLIDLLKENCFLKPSCSMSDMGVYLPNKFKIQNEH